MIVSSAQGDDIKHAMAHFVAQRQDLPFPMWGDHTSIGLIRGEGDERRLVAAVIYNHFEAANVFMHIGAEEGCRWMTAEYLRICFEYPFAQLQKNRVTALIAKRNKRAARFVTKLGFKYEGCMPKHYADDDMLIYGMLRENCPYLALDLKPISALRKVA